MFRLAGKAVWLEMIDEVGNREGLTAMQGNLDLISQTTGKHKLRCGMMKIVLTANYSCSCM